jgi:hypothetical protein
VSSNYSQIKKHPLAGCFFDLKQIRILPNGNFGAANALACKSTNFAAGKGDNTVTRCMDCEVAAEHSAVAGALREANLTNDDLTDGDLLTAEEFDTKPLALAVSGIFGGTASFHM